MDTITWGILSTAKIGVDKVIPAIQQADNCIVKGIASRSKEKAVKTAQKLTIPDAYGSYKKLLADSSVDAIYNPLPNHLHVPKTLEALEAGKHVLCEKPIALNTQEARKLLTKANEYPKLKVMEAFMYRFHPQWKKAKALVTNGTIGTLKTVNSFFSYYNDDPDNIRNKPDIGGGGLMDIGCYCISLSRFLFDEEPTDITGYWKIDPDFYTDYLASGTLRFNSGTATFTCATQTAPHQQVTIVGTDGRIVMEIPFNAPPDQTIRIWLYKNGKKEEITFPPVNQYTLQAKAFSDAVIKDDPVPTPLTNAVNNMTAIDAFRKSAKAISD
ncbi:NAD-binding protein [Aliifodinibius salipaludis]|uniref:NAD-binding protein n=1 Tax=Fodinibius salipaludis TaxID=2032627 RepID=A0A2A2G9K3_9BACT|nr:Gfo/Idh/MocA family oxidoreductase [Aliifodinibius salipaludis]PAU93850.1 NAD-binding protein [Aliifodinibius salipaludis]